MTNENLDRFVETAIDGFEGYPMFQYVFNGRFNAELLRRQIAIDLRTGSGTVAGVTSSEQYESVMIISPPLVPEIGIIKYVRAIHPKDYPIFFKSATKRQVKYEKYAYKKREGFLDDKTWYIYIFVTKNRFKRQGYGKRLIKLIKDFADTNGYRLILETDLDENIAMYEKFGFSLQHCQVMSSDLC